MAEDRFSSAKLGTQVLLISKPTFIATTLEFSENIMAIYEQPKGRLLFF
jgi:hypothetical protein